MKAAAFAYALLSAPLGVAPADAPLKPQIVELPPYMTVRAGNSVGGLAVDPALAAFRKAGIPVVWEVVPAARQLNRIKEARERLCSVGWSALAP